MEWTRDTYPELLKVTIGSRPAKVGTFYEECIAAAKEIAESHNEDGIAVLVDESYESAVTLLSFMKVGAKFSVYYIDYVNLTPEEAPAYYRLVEWARGQGLHPKPIKFDYNDAEQMSALEKLQEYPLNSYPEELFKTWASCHIDGFLVLPGTFSYPVFNDDSSLRKWLLPEAKHFGIMNFFKKFGGVPFFLNYSPELIYSQVDSVLSCQLLSLAKNEQRMISRSSIAAKQVFAEQAFPEIAALVLADIMYPVQMAAIHNCKREVRDRFFSFLKKAPKPAPQIVQNINVRFDLVTEVAKANSFPARLYAISERTDIRGNVIETAVEQPGHKGLAMFPVLTTLSYYQGNLKDHLAVVETLQYFRTQKVASTNPELHLNPQLSELMKFFRESVELYLKEMKYVYSGFDIVQCWANRYQAGQHYEHFHTHPNCLLSGVFYLTSGGGGNTVFKSARRHQIMPSMKRMNQWNTVACEIAPEAGKLLIFPADVDHNTKPHGDAENPKYTIAFNVMFRS